MEGKQDNINSNEFRECIPYASFVNPIRILLLAPTHSRMTGADRDWINLVNAFNPAETQVTWVGVEGTECLRPYLQNETCREIYNAGFPTFHYPIQIGAYQQRSRWLWTKIIADHVMRLLPPVGACIRRWHRREFDIIVSNGASTTIGSLLSLYFRKPHVWCVKECLDVNRAAMGLVRYINQTCDVVAVPSKAVAETFRNDVRVLPDGNPLEAIKHSARQRSREDVLQELNLPSHLPVVAQNGGIVEWKGGHVLAKALRILALSGEPPPCSLLFLGKSIGNYHEKVDSILNELPKSWNSLVRIIEFQPDDFSYLAAADLVVHPSILPDPFPNAVRESMILGKPVIGSNSGGIPEMVEHGQTGLLFEPGNSEELAVNIRNLIRSPALRDTLGWKAARHAEKHFDIQRNKNAFLSLFREVIAQSKLPVKKRGNTLTG